MSEFVAKADTAAFFRTTHWSVVLTAGADTPATARALETLCRTYWYPLYAFLRRRGHQPAEAQDLTQEFFSRLLDGNSLQNVQPEKGRFRTYLLAAMKRFLAQEWRDAHRLKRGGNRQILSWDSLDAEERYGYEPQTNHSPEEFFDRHWAQTVVATALARLRAEMEREGNGVRFDLLKGHLQNAGPVTGYAETAASAGLSEAAVKSAIHRLRRRYAEIVRDEVAQTVASPAEADEEIRRLIKVLAS